MKCSRANRWGDSRPMTVATIHPSFTFISGSLQEVVDRIKGHENASGTIANSNARIEHDKRQTISKAVLISWRKSFICRRPAGSFDLCYWLNHCHKAFRCSMAEIIGRRYEKLEPLHFLALPSSHRQSRSDKAKISIEYYSAAVFNRIR